MTCRVCGAENAEGAAFCANCGTSTTPAAGAVATAADPGHASAPLTPASDQRKEEDQLLVMAKKELGGDYRIDKELGRGGMAVVYKGVEIALERTVAIKIVPPDSANVGQAAERFRREARLAASLDHPNIIPVYRVGQAGPLHYMAMKFVEGRAVDSIIDSQGALPLNVAIAILKYSAMGLAFAHEKKIVHRDVKGANVLVDKDGRVMVSDFGIARALEEVSLTASGMVIGTPYFMSPEQCGGLKVSPQSDQYSLGVMGFQLLTGEVPFNADSMVGIIQHHYMTPVPDILAVRQDVPRELLEVIYCSLNKDPKDRFTTTKEMAMALESIPQTDQEREGAEQLLRQLSMGQAIPKVRTGTLPPLALTISGPAAPVQPRPITMPRSRPAIAPAALPRKKKKKNKMLPYVLGLLAVAVIGGGGLGVYQYQQVQKQNVTEAAHNDSVSHGTVVVVVTPANAAVTFNGVPYTGPVRADTGKLFAVSASASGYQTLQQTGTARSEETDTIQLQLPATTVANSAPQAPMVQQPTRQAPASGSAAPSQPAVKVVTDSGTATILVTPPYADISVDGIKVGTGRVINVPLAVGSHTVRYSASNCDTKEATFDIQKNTLARVPTQTLICH